MRKTVFSKTPWVLALVTVALLGLCVEDAFAQKRGGGGRSSAGARSGGGKSPSRASRGPSRSSSPSRASRGPSRSSSPSRASRGPSRSSSPSRASRAPSRRAGPSRSSTPSRARSYSPSRSSSGARRSSGGINARSGSRSKSPSRSSYGSSYRSSGTSRTPSRQRTYAPYGTNRNGVKLAPSRSRGGKLSTSGSRLGSPSRSSTRLGSRNGGLSSSGGKTSRRLNSNTRGSLGKTSGRVGSGPRSARPEKAASEYRSRLSTRLGKTSAKNARISRPGSNATLSRGTPRVNAARSAGKAVGSTGPRSTARAPKTYSHNGIRPTTTPRKGPRVTGGSTSTNSGFPHHSDNHYPHDGYGGHDYDHDYDHHHNHHHHHHHHHGHGFHFGFHLGLGYFGWYGYRYRPWYGHYFRHSYYYPWYGYAHFPYYWSYHLYPSYRTTYYVDYVDYSDSTYYRDYPGYTSDPYDGYGDSYLSPSVVDATEEAAPFGTSEGLTLAPANSLATPFASNVNTGRSYDDAIQASDRFAKSSQFPQAAEAARQAYLRQATAPALQRVSLALLASGDFPMASWAMVLSIGSSQPSLVAYSVLLSDYLGGPEVSRSIRNLEAYLVDNTNDEASNLLLGAMYTMTGRDYAGYMIMNRLQSAGYEVETVKLFSDQARAALGK